MPPLPYSRKRLAAPEAIMPATTMSEEWMTALDPSLPEPQLTLKSQLEDLTLVRPWVEAIATRYSVPANTQFAIELCLEEALSNIIRHGYRGQTNQAISTVCTVESTPSAAAAAELVFTVEDHAPPFDPLARFDDAPASAPVSFEDFPPGGQGIRLMRKFADRLAWHRLLDGNRLTLAFAIPPVANP
jgi:anti-sigma regulatory factor (Ser/Thr protein kinase)